MHFPQILCIFEYQNKGNNVPRGTQKQRLMETTFYQIRFDGVKISVSRKCFYTLLNARIDKGLETEVINKTDSNNNSVVIMVVYGK